MSGEGSPTAQYQARPVDCSDVRVAVLAASWHQQVMDGLVAGALRALDDFGAVAGEVVRVPGSFELPVVAQECARSFDAVICLGVIIRGGTPHFEFVSSAATDGLTRVALDAATPIGFGVLTCDDDEQALDRAGLPDSREDKGAEAAWAAIMTALTLRDLRASVRS